MNKRIKTLIASLVICTYIMLPVSAIDAIPPVQGEAIKGRIITPKCDKLIYNTYNEQGDTLGDFSYAGFYAGQYEIPDTTDMEPYVTLEPDTDGLDDSERIQAAIEEARLAAGSTHNFTVVKLKAGKYYLENSNGIYLKSGVILSGEGQGPDGTVIIAGADITGAPINVEGTPITTDSAIGQVEVTDKYVKSGSYDLTLEDASFFEVGDLIKITQPWTKEWTDALGMNNLENGMSWYANDERVIFSDVSMERTITGITGNVITVDMPMYAPVDATYSTPYVEKISTDRRVEHIGIENLRVEVDEEALTEGGSNHASAGIVFEQAKNCYVRDVTSKHFWRSCVAVTSESKQITVKNCSYLEPVSPDAGGYRYSFRVAKAQQVLISGCYSYNSRHDYITTGLSAGPVVFVDCVVDSSNQATENHGFWATGTLYDNVLSIGNEFKGYMALSNRGAYGTVDEGSHGWSAVGTVAWNCLFPLIVGNKPPMNYNNFIAGQWGYYNDDIAQLEYSANLVYSKSIYRVNFGDGIQTASDDNFKTYENSSIAGDCYVEAADTTVTPRSLYNAQLARRLTADRRNAKPTAPVITAPRAEELLNDNNVIIEGLKLSIAEKVNVYVDNVKYTATINDENNTFSLNLNLDDGVHKIYATQTVRGVEGTKCADRFITVNESNGNAAYLESQYEYDRIHPVKDDSVISYDAYANIENGLTDRAMPLNVYVNGRNLETDVVAIMSNGFVMVPLRAVSEQLLAEVLWNPDTNTAIVRKNDKSFSIEKNSGIASLGERYLGYDFMPMSIDGRLMVPLEYLANQFDAEININSETNTVFIKEKI